MEDDFNMAKIKYATIENFAKFKELFDESVQKQIETAAASGLKSVSIAEDKKHLYFFTTQEAGQPESAAFTIELPSTDEIDKTLKSLETRVAANEAAITKLNGDYTVEGSVDKKVSDAILKIVDGAGDSFDTLKEIETWINDHQGGAASMNEQITTNKNDIAALKKLVGTLPEDASSQTIVEYIKEAIDDEKADLASLEALNAAIARITQNETDITALEEKVGEGFEPISESEITALFTE